MTKARFLLTSLMLLLVCGMAQAQFSWSGTQNFNSSETITDAITLVGNTTVNVATGQTLTLKGAVSGGTYSLTKAGGGTLLFDNGGMSAITTVVISAGKIQIGTGVTTGRNSFSTITIASGANLTWNMSTGQTFSSVVSGAGTLTKMGTGTLTLAGNNTCTGAATVQTGILRIGNNGTTGAWAGNIAVSSGTTLQFYRSNDYAYSGVISGAGTVTQMGAGQITLNTASTYTGKTTVQGGNLALGASGSILSTSEIAVLSGKTLTISNSTDKTYVMPITGEGNVVKEGAGLATMTQPQWTGNTGSAGGGLRLEFAEDATFASSGITNTGVLRFAVAPGKTVTYNGVISGTAGVAVWGGGTLILGGASTCGAYHAAREGVLQLNQNAISGANNYSDHLEVNAGSEIVFNPTSTTAFSKVISGAGKVTKKGSAVLQFTADNTYTGETTVETGTLYLGAGTATGKVAGNIVLSNTTSMVGFGCSTVYTYSGVISGAGKVFVGASLTFNGMNTYEGTTSITSATLTLGANGTIANSSQVYLGSNTAKFNISAGNKSIKSLSSEYANAEVILGASYLSISETGLNTYAGKITGTGGISKYSAGTLKLTGTASTYSGTTSLKDGVIEFSDAASLGTSQLAFNETGGTLRWATGNTADISARIASISTAATFEINEGIVQFQTTFPSSATAAQYAGSVTKTGAGQLNYFQNAKYTGVTNINGGVLDIAGTAGAITSSTINVAQGATLACSRSTAYTYSGRIAGAGTVSNSIGTLTLTGTNTFTGSLAVNANVNIGSGNTVGSIAANATVASGDTLAFNRSNAYTYAGVISGAGLVRKLGAGALTFSGANTYTGVTDIAAGSLILNATGTIASSSNVKITGASAKFQIEADKTVKGLESSQSGSQVVINNGTLTVANTSAQTFAGVISGAGGFIKSGNIGINTYSYTLTNANTYSGTTTVKSNSLILAAGGSIANSQNIVLSKVNLTAGTVNYGKLDISAGNKTILNLTGTAYNDVVLGSNTLQIGSGTSSGDGGGDFKGKFIGANGKVTKTGFLPLTLSGASTATGLLSHAAGTLMLSDGASWAGNYAQASGATLEVNGNVTIGGTFTLAGGGTIDMDLTAATPAKINVIGAASLSGATTMNVSAATGNFTLIEAASGVNSLSRFSFAAVPGMTLTPTLGTDNSKTQLKLGVATTDGTAPTAGTSISAGTATATSIPLTWGVANDDITAVTNLHYTVYRSAQQNISTPAFCESNGTPIASGANFTSHTATGLEPNTTYWFNVVVKDQSNNKTAYGQVSVTTAKAALGGTVTIMGNAVFGETLTANVTGLTSTPTIADLGTVAYQWKRGSTNIGTNATYTLMQGDIANTITVTVITANTQGSVTSTATQTVQKAEQAKPAAPTLASATHNSITLNTVAGAEYYCMQSPGYQDSPAYTGLSPEGSYAFALRMKATATHNESEMSDWVQFSTLVEPTVTSVTVTPATATVQKGQTQQFSAAVVVTGAATQDVTWSIVGTHHANTTISASGLLTVAAAEPVGLTSLQVKATSNFDGNVYGTAQVTLTEVPKVTNIEVTADDNEVMKGQTLQFSANVTTQGGASNGVSWSIVEAHNASTTVSASGLLTVATAETATSLTIRATSTFNSSRYGEMTVTVLEIPAVNSVTVSPLTASVQKGQTQQFSAAVVVAGGASTAVTWSVEGAVDAGTTIDGTGFLTVSPVETASSLTVKATSDFDSDKVGTATVTVIPFTGIEDVVLADVKLYPSPFVTSVIIENAEGADLRVVDIKGQTVEYQNIVSSSQEISVSNLTSGIYLFCLTKDGKMRIMKAVKK